MNRSEQERNFRAYQQIRSESRAYGVFGITKKGTPDRKASWTCKTETEANEKCAYIASLNPGRKFVVLPIA